MGEEAPKSGVVSLVSNLVLVGTAGWGLKSCLDHPFICAGFGLFVVRGIVGTVAYFDVKNETFETVKKHLIKFVDNFGFPLMAMDIMSCRCLRPAFSLLQLLGPAVDFVGFELDWEKSKDVIVIAHSMTAGATITCGQQKPHFWGTILFPLPYIADILSKKVFEVEDYHEVFLAIGCILAVLIMTEKIP